MNRQEELLMEKGEEVGDGTAEGSSAIGDGGRTLISFIPDVDGIRFCFLAGFNSIYPLEKNDPGLVWMVSNSFSHHKRLSSTGLHSEQLLQHLCTLCSGPLPQKLTMPPPTKKTPLPFPVS